MDFSKFRDSGDLSDLVVVVEGHENHLHRFPLYAKSDYFCGLARGTATMMAPSPTAPTKCRVELADFPGGQEVFGVVADFCYNMAPKVTKDTVVQLRCAAHYLQMAGPANLAQAADRYLQDILTSAKLSRSCSPLVTLLLHCASVGPLAGECGVVDTCTDALVDTLLKSPTKFSPPSLTSASSSGSGAFTSQGSAFMPTKPSQSLSSTLSPAAEDHQGLKNLSQLPEDWFANFLKKALERGVAQSLLAEMAVHYVSRAIDRDGEAGQGAQGSAMNGHSTPICGGGDGPEAAEDVEDLDKDIDSLGVELREEAEIGESPFVPYRVVDVGELLDTVLTTLPEEAYNVPSLTLDWLTKVLRIATAGGCSCRRFLVKIAADMLTRLPAEELCLVSPSVLHDIVLEARDDDSEAERACLLVDTFLAQMAKKGVLTAETFRLLANATPPDVRRNHDNLYEVLEYVLQAEKDSLTDEQQQELVSTIHLDQVCEDTLQRALNSSLVPPVPIAQAALKLCASLRSELDSVKFIAQMQEEELTKYQTRAALLSSSSPHSSPRGASLVHHPLPAFASLKVDSDSGFSDSNHDPKTASPAAPESSASDHVRAAQTVLSSARSKLAMPLYAGHRPYLPSSSHPAYPSPSSSSSAAASVLEHDMSLQDELDFRLDRGSSFRSLEPSRRARHFPGLGTHHASSSSSSSSQYHHHRSTYFPYSPRF